MGETYYDRLGVSSDASTEEITTAYREKLKETHPDVSDERDAKERTKRLIEAKEVLTDEDERSRYDRLGHRQYVSLEGQSAGTTRTATSTAESTETTGTGGTTGTRTGTGDATGTRAGTGPNRNTERSSTASTTGGRASTARWYDGTSSETSGGGQATSSRQGADGPNTWRAWNTGGSYAVRRGGDTFQHGRIFTSNRAFVLLGITFLVYPVLVFGALYPYFPLGLRLAIAVCAILLIAFLQSVPEVGIAVFGIWSLLLPVVLFGTRIPVFTIEGALAMVAVLFPLGLSLLTRIAVRPMSV